MSDSFRAMLDDATEAARRLDERARLVAASRDFRLLGSPWRLVFAAGDRTLFLPRFERELGMPEIAQVLQSAFRPLPLPVAIGPEEAARRLDDFPPPYDEVTLSWPIAPGVEHPCYTFVKGDAIRAVDL